MREKVGKLRNTVFFPMICGSGGSKSRLAKAAGAEPCGQMRDENEKLHAVVARSTYPSQNVQNYTILRPLLEVEVSKKCAPLWREAHLQVKKLKTPHVRSTFENRDVEKMRASTFRRQHVKSTTCSDHFLTQMSFCVAGARDSARCQK